MAAPGRWTTGLFDCLTDCSSCCCAWWCPCVVVGRLAHIVDAGRTSCCAAGCMFIILPAGCKFLYTCGYRAKLRHTFGLPEEPCSDICVDFWCIHCSIAQSYRELKNRGIDPSLGYEAVKGRVNPPGTQFMER